MSDLPPAWMKLDRGLHFLALDVGDRFVPWRHARLETLRAAAEAEHAEDPGGPRAGWIAELLERFADQLAAGQSLGEIADQRPAAPRLVVLDGGALSPNEEWEPPEGRYARGRDVRAREDGYPEVPA